MLYKNWNHKQKHFLLFFLVKFLLLKSNEILSLLPFLTKFCFADKEYIHILIQKLTIVLFSENIPQQKYCKHDLCVCLYTINPKLYFQLSSHVVKNQIFFKELFRSLQKLAYGSGMKWIRKKKKETIWNRFHTENFQRNITLCKWYIWRLFEWDQFH